MGARAPAALGEACATARASASVRRRIRPANRSFALVSPVRYQPFKMVFASLFGRFLSAFLFVPNAVSYSEHSDGKIAPRPSHYASFIIAPGFPPKIIAEDQDRFEFPDKKVSYRVKGPDLEHLGNLLRSGKPPSYLTEESDGGEEEEDESADLPYSVHSPQDAITGNNSAAVLDSDNDNFFVARDKFVGAGSAVWSEFDGTLYVADAYGGKVYRFVNPSLARSNGMKGIEEEEEEWRFNDYIIQSLSFRNAFLFSGLIGPAIPLNQSGGASAGEVGGGDVTLAAGFDSEFFNFFPWKLDKDEPEGSAVPQASYSTKKELDHSETERYNRLSFAVRDPGGRIVTASVDVREEMQPHPCFDFLVWFDPDKLTRKSVFLNVLRHADKLVCSPAGLAFDSRYLAYYADRVTKKLLSFEYDVGKGELGESAMVADFSDYPGTTTSVPLFANVRIHLNALVGLMTGLVADNAGRLWSGFRGSGEIIAFNPSTSAVADTIQLPMSTNGRVVDLAFDKNYSILYVLTDKSLLHFQL